MKSAIKTFVVLTIASSVLGGCAVYGPPPAYGYGYGPEAYYGQAAPVYVQPAPVYVQPPVSFGFSYGYWGGGHHHHH